MPCTVCSHNQVKDIDRALLTGATLISLSQIYGLSKSAMHRHKTHLLEKIGQAKKRLRDSLDQGLFFKLNTYLELSLHTVRAAGAENNFRAVNQTTREGTRVIALMKKMEFELDEELVYCLMNSPRWDLDDSLIPGAFLALADTRHTMAVNLNSPCPEPDPDCDHVAAAAHVGRDPQGGVSQSDAPPAIITQNSELSIQDSPSELETSLPANLPPDLDEKSLALLQKHFPSLVHTQSPQLSPQDSELRTFLEEWEKSGKSPGKSRSTANINEQNHEDISDTKIPGKSSQIPPLETQNSELETHFQGASPVPAETLPGEQENQAPPADLQSHTSSSPADPSDSDLTYEQYLQEIEQEKQRSGNCTQHPQPPDPVSADENQNPETGSQQPETKNSKPKTKNPKPQPSSFRKPLDPVKDQADYLYALAHGHRREDCPKHVPDRRWEEDFGNPRKIKGSY